MSETKWQVDCENVATARLLATEARKAGWKRGIPDDGIETTWLYTSNRGLFGFHQEQQKHKTLSIPEAIERILAGPPKDDSIYVEAEGDRHEVEFLGDSSVQIGCELFPKEVLEEIARRVESGPLHLRDRHIGFRWSSDTKEYMSVEYRGSKIPIDTVRAILKRAGITAKSEPEPEPGIFREFVEALVEGEREVENFAIRQGGSKPGPREDLDDLRKYHRYVARKVLAAAKSQPTPPAFTAEERGTLRMLFHCTAGHPQRSHYRYILSMEEKLDNGPHLGRIPMGQSLTFSDDD